MTRQSTQPPQAPLEKAVVKVKTDKEGRIVSVNGATVDQTIAWKLYYDTNTKKPVGVQGSSVVVCAPDEILPPLVNKPHWFEEREAIMLIIRRRPS